MRTKDQVSAELTAARNQMATHQGRARTIDDTAKNESRDLTDAESGRIDALFTLHENAQADVKRLEAELLEMDAAPRPSAGRVAAMAPPNARPGGFGSDGPTASVPATGPKFFNMFPAARTHRVDGFQNLGEFAAAVWKRDPKLFTNAASGMSEGVGADGGFYVPPQFLAGIVDDSLEAESVRPRATIIPMTSSEITIPLFDTTDRSTGVAGLNPTATQEGSGGTTQKPKVMMMSLRASKQAILVPTTSELLMDAPAVFAAMLQAYMGEAMSQKVDDCLINGGGAGEPLGILNAPATIVVTKESGQASGTILPQNLANMISRLTPGSFNRAVWLVHSSVLPQLFQLKIIVQNVAASENVGGFGPNWFVVAPDGSMTLFGRPMIITDKALQVGTKGDVILADLKQYFVGMRQDATLDVSRDVGFKEDEIWFRLKLRFDGQPGLKSAITQRHGTATVSPFVVIQSR